jgi:predicted metal-dependent hydrolase
MTPAEHYAEAERLLEAAKDDMRNVDPDSKLAYLVRVVDRATFAIAAAGVHARLAALPAERLVGVS